MERHSCCGANSADPAESSEKPHCKSEQRNNAENSCCCKHAEENSAAKESCHRDSACKKNAGKTCCHGHNKDDKHTGGKNTHEDCCGTKRGNGILNDGTKLAISAVALLVGFCIFQFDIHIPYYPYSDPSWIAVFLCSGAIFSAAFRGLLAKKINTAMLVSLAMIASFGLQIAALLGFDVSGDHCASYIFVVGEIAFLMALGSWLEDRTLAKTAEGLAKLSNLMPKIAFVKRGEKVVQIPSEEIETNDIVCVNSGEMISADGVIVKGETSVDQSNMTGESIPVDKKVGDEVLCGTFNTGSYIEVRATKPANASVVSRLIELVEEAEGKRAPIARAANRWASYVVPTAILTSVIVFAVAFWGLNAGLPDSIVRGVTILVVFCPCAFVLATPTAISAGIGNAAKNGVLIKSGEALETLSKITAVFFDKTGTLTKGKVRVEKFTFEKNAEGKEREILKAVAALERKSGHPLARALEGFAESKIGNDTIPETENATQISGGGMSGKVCGKFFEIKKSQGEGSATSSEIFEDGVLLAKVEFADEPRDSAPLAVSSLIKAGIKVAMLSGDNLASAEKVAKKAGIKDVAANLLPKGKLDYIKRAQKTGERVCMVGDGVNDAPSLATADTSIAIADLKSDIAIDAARISLLGDDLRKIPALLSFSKSVMGTISTNIVFSLSVSLGAIILGVFGIITPGIGALVHNASSVCVVLNSARLLRSKRLSIK